ncbi:MAG: SEC-C domain-containing protein [Candidatus Nanopelagicales bacterium]|jgi:hypothetical protein|nr:SEC-C domain-containing protein [Candidatus Nanopelagicales bacterium]
MGKKSKRPVATEAAQTTGDVAVVSMREPCPCGSGRRYKACHGKEASRPTALTSRPFEGFTSECDIVAMRELVPSATTSLTISANGIAAQHAGRTVTLATVLPLAYPALVRTDGSVLLGLQVNVGSADASRDVAGALLAALEAEPGQPVSIGRMGADSPRLQDVVDTKDVLTISVFDDFAFWIEDSEAELAPDVKASLDRAKDYAHPTSKLSSVQAAYWTQMGEKEHLRWIMPFEEDALVTALARLHAASASSLGTDTRLVGMFRAQGLVVPVWDLPLGFGAAALEEPAATFGERLDEALAVTTPMTDAERRARAGLTNRQVTLR